MKTKAIWDHTVKTQNSYISLFSLYQLLNKCYIVYPDLNKSRMCVLGVCCLWFCAEDLAAAASIVFIRCSFLHCEIYVIGFPHPLKHLSTNLGSISLALFTGTGSFEETLPNFHMLSYLFHIRSFGRCLWCFFNRNSLSLSWVVLMAKLIQ